VQACVYIVTKNPYVYNCRHANNISSHVLHTSLIVFSNSLIYTCKPFSYLTHLPHQYSFANLLLALSLCPNLNMTNGIRLRNVPNSARMRPAY
jgi:hypothetical protein